MKRQLAVLLILAPLLSGCAKVGYSNGDGLNSGSSAPAPDPGNGGSGGGGGASPQACTLENNVYVRCQAVTVGSVRESITQVSTDLTTTTDVFPLNNTCSGTPTASVPVTAQANFGTPGGSAVIPGATDLQLTSASDLGCGAGLSTFSTLQFSNDCSQMQSTASACSAGAQGTSLDASVYLLQ